VPDEHIGYLAGGWVTEGQLLSLPMIILGLAFLAWAYRARVPSGNYLTRQ
jgi:phosphatidylglycerol:prolipoprotein diacylglycerol transferase